jgi:hypothetical protein
MATLFDRPHPDPIKDLQGVISGGGQRVFDVVPTLLRNIMTQRLWEGRKNAAGESFGSFEAFVTCPLWHGLASTIDDLLVFTRNDTDVQAMIKGEIGAIQRHGTNRHTGSNATSSDDRGATYVLKRLKRDRPDLAEKVIRGELSAHAAAISGRR